jgi:hypothetical protein
MNKRMSFDANAVNAMLLCYHCRRPTADERVKQPMGLIQAVVRDEGFH